MQVITIRKSPEGLTEFTAHQHEYWEILYHLSGSGSMTINKVPYSFKDGEIAIIPPNTSRYKKAEVGGAFQDISMIISELRPIGSGEVITQILDDEKRTICTLMEMILHFYQNQAELGTNRTKALLNALAESVYQALVVYFQKGIQKNLRLEGIIELMEVNISNPDFDLAKEIERTGYCKGYFRKMFKELVGEAPLSYFNRMRIEYAKREFHQYGPSKSIKNIALTCGFRDPYYFSRVFHKITGVSPSAYLNEMLKDEK